MFMFGLRSNSCRPRKSLRLGLCFTILLSLGIAAGEEVGSGPVESPPAANNGRQNLMGRLPRFSPNGQRILMLMVDGLAARPFEKALESGDLPNLAKLRDSRPTVIHRAISTFPSATSPSVPEMVSGRYAEIENLPAPGAVHAFDRERRRVIRYVTSPDSWQWPMVTLFDATRDLPAITVFEGRWDGPKSVLTQFNMAKQAALEIIGAGKLGDGDRGPVEAFLRAVRGTMPPSVSLVVFNDFDMSAHFWGPESENAREALIAADSLLGEIVRALATKPGAGRGSMLDETNIILFGDHGHVTSGEFVDLVAFFGQRRLKAVDVSTVPHVIFRERLGTLWTEWPEVILVSGGSNVTQLYLKQLPGSWQKSAANPVEPGAAAPDLRGLAEEIAGEKGVAQVLWLDRNGHTNVVAEGGRAARVLERSTGEDKSFAYVTPASAESDPFDYLEDPRTRSLVCPENRIGDACFRSRVEWFDATFESRYPGAVPLIPKAFHPERFTGDLIVTLKPGFSFIRGQKGDHGNLERDAVITPLVLNGPGVTPGPESHRPKLVDLYPTAAVMLGADPDDPAFRGLDGRVLDCVRPRGAAP